MRKTILSIILISLFASQGLCQQGVTISGTMLAGAAGGGAPAGETYILGNDNIEANAYAGYPGASYTMGGRKQASNSGTLRNAYIYHNDTTNANVIICVYTATSTVPAVGDTLVACSGNIESGTTTGWKEANFASGTITATNYYRIIQNSKNGEPFATRQASATTAYYVLGQGWYANPPASNLSGLVSSDNWGDLSFYVTYQ